MEGAADIPLAVIGMACHLPGADDLEQYWQLVKGGHSAAGEIPPERFDRDLYYDPKKGVHGKSYTSIACLVNYRSVDTRRCPLTEEQIATSDIAHVTMCEVACEACYHAGLDPFHMPPVKCGVYIGHTKGSGLGGEITYSTLIEQTAQYLREIHGFDQAVKGRTDAVIRQIVHSVRQNYPHRDERGNPDLSGFLAAGLISKTLSLDGPFMAVNAACASSLQALAIGARALQLGHIDMAIVGGASYCKVDSLIMFSRAESVSATGSRPFDAEADGLVVGEGYVALLVKTLDRARADNDRIHAVIRGIGISSDGHGKSLWAPRKEGQVEAIRRAYRSGLDMSRLQYIEAHATSTQVGDYTEIAALAEALTDKLPSATKIPIGSVKANIGHTIEAAGLAGLLKVVLSMQHAVVPPAVNVRNLNPRIDWDRVPFYVPRAALEWPAPTDGHPRRAGVNSFGIGGLNVHVVVDDGAPVEAPPLKTRRAEKPAAPVSNNEPIAIIGMGAVFPGARTTDAYWDLLRSGRDPKTTVPADRWNAEIGHEPGSRRPFRCRSVLGGFITNFEYDWRVHKIPPKQVASADPLQFMLLDAVEQAFRMAGYSDGKPLDRKRAGVCVGSVMSGEFHEHLQIGLHLPRFERELSGALSRHGVPGDRIREISERFGEIVLRRMPALMDETGSYTSSTLASRITKTFDLMGGATAIDAGCASGFAALSACIDLLRAGDCDMMVCAAGQRSMGLLAYEWHSLRGVLPSEPPQNPLDHRANGFVPGEGAGALILKRVSDARRDGDKVHGAILGVGVARSDSFEQAMRAAIRYALDEAQLKPEDVSFVEAAACGVPKTDRQETEALVACYGATARREPLLLGALVSHIGHTGGASSMASLLKATLALNHRQMPPNVGFQAPAPFIKEHEQTLKIPAAPLPLSHGTENGRLLAGVDSSCGEDLAYHLLVESTSTTHHITSTRRPGEPLEAVQWRIVRASADSLAQLADKASRMAGEPDAAFAAADSSAFAVRDRARLAVVAQSAAELQKKLLLAAKELPRTESRSLLQEKGIFCHRLREQRPCVAFLFPGHGSQYPGMLRSLVQEFAPAGAAMRRIDAILVRLGYPSFAQIAWERSDQLGTDVWQTQLSLLVADMILYELLTALGARADRVSGHSFGEFPALVAAGAWSFEAAARATRARCAAIQSCPGALGVMMSVEAPAAMLERLIQETDLPLYISVRNAPDQTVVAGDERAAAKLAERLRQDNIFTHMLPVPRPFHTPLMEGMKEPWASALARISIEPPLIPILSSVSNRYVAEPDEIRENLISQMTRPVHYAELIQRLARGGVSIFVEVGPHQILTRLHRRILSDADLTFISSDQPKRSGLQQLLAVQACLESAGALGQTKPPQPYQAAEPPSPESPVATGPPIAPGRAPSSEIASQRSQPSSPAQGPSSDGLPRPQSVVLPLYPSLNVLLLSGTPYEMGLAHGQAQAQQIKTILRRYADLAGTEAGILLEVEKAAAEPEIFFGADGLEELGGIAEGAGVPLPSIIAHNLRLYPDIGAGCSHFARNARSNPTVGLLHAANEDQPLTLRMRDCLYRNVQVRLPAGGISHLAFGTAGQLAAINGVNAKGLAVTSAMLLDLPRRADTARGRVHGVIVKTILERAGDIDSAIDVLRSLPGTSAWALCISHHPTDELCYLEYDGKSVKAERGRSMVAGTNHSTLHSRVAEVPPHSQNRLDRLMHVLGNGSEKPLTIEQANSLLRDRFDVSRARETPYPTMNTIRRVDNQISLLMHPAAGDMWVTAGAASRDNVDQFYRLRVQDLFGSAPFTSVGDERKQTPVSEIRIPAPPAKQEESVCKRFVMRMVETPLPEERAFSFHGAVLLVGQNRIGQALRERLGREGANVLELPAGDNPDEALAALDHMWQSTPAPHLVLLTPHDGDALAVTDEGTWTSRRLRGVWLPYLLCQRWYQWVLQAGLVEKASVVAATALGGDFGFSGNVRNFEGGALTGLLKALHQEIAARTDYRFTAKIVDAAETETPEQITEAISRELAVADREVEVGYSGGKRFVVRPLMQPVSELSRDSEIPRGGVWVVTGGARGITAVVARELGRRYQLKLHLIGSSPLPRIEPSWRNASPDALRDIRARVMKEASARGEVPIQAWIRVEKTIEIDGNLRLLAENGVRYTYHSCDVADRSGLARVLDGIRRADGPIQGIIHGAGFESSLRFDRKKRDLVDLTIATKVDGAVALMDLTWNDPLRYFIAFGSVSGRFGVIGQTDYSLANDMLSKLVSWHHSRRPDCRSVCFHWHAWDGVGMAVRPERWHIREFGNVRYMPSREGMEHLVNELRAGVPEREVLITTWPFHRLTPEQANRIGRAPMGSKLTAAADRSAGEPATSLLADLPLIHGILEMDPGRSATAEIHLDPTTDPFLAQHRFKDRPILPAAIGMAALAQAGFLLGQGARRVVELRNVDIKTPLRFHTDRIQTARVRAGAQGDDVHCELTGDFHNRSGKLVQADRLYLQATVRLSDQPAPLGAGKPKEGTSWKDYRYPDRGLLYHGDVCRALKAVSMSDSEGWGSIVSAAPNSLGGKREGANWIVPALVIDAGFVTCAVHARLTARRPVANLPKFIERLRLGRLPRDGEVVMAHVRCREMNPDSALYDLTILGDDESVIVQIEGYKGFFVAQGAD
jgi:acyl transferase domain-containing protein/NAD(P)-dependent dehydrogenase (short-subunit alcohol dehydrogenase family)